jgi:Xaa-Pro aminopeptidase
MKARIEERTLEAAGPAMREEGVDGWLLYDLEGRNGIASQLLGLPEGTTRRHFVLLRPDREPAALTHRIESQTWEEWEGRHEEYVGWEEMEEKLARLLEGCRSVAMEISRRDAVPFVDQVPAGVVELVEDCGVEVVGSAGLVSRTCARWTPRGRRLHDRAGEVLASTARQAFRRAARGVREGSPLDEREVADWVLDTVDEAGLGGGGVIVAGGPNTALPHYEPPAEGSRALERGDVFLVDLWARVRDEPEAVFADQTWMGVLDDGTPEGFPDAWAAVRDARDGAVELIERRVAEGEAPTGAEVDRRAREVLFERGFEEEVLHRTGHGMDRANHGFGPNLDCVETRDERRLVEGVGFSVEPGVYLQGRWGIRSEINVVMGPAGPEVTTPAMQDEPWTLDG